jgi:hypothetical protein
MASLMLDWRAVLVIREGSISTAAYASDVGQRRAR